MLFDFVHRADKSHPTPTPTPGTFQEVKPFLFVHGRLALGAAATASYCQSGSTRFPESRNLLLAGPASNGNNMRPGLKSHPPRLGRAGNVAP
jgi:hypothetical protein